MIIFIGIAVLLMAGGLVMGLALAKAASMGDSAMEDWNDDDQRHW